MRIKYNASELFIQANLRERHNVFRALFYIQALTGHDTHSECGIHYISKNEYLFVIDSKNDNEDIEVYKVKNLGNTCLIVIAFQSKNDIQKFSMRLLPAQIKKDEKLLDIIQIMIDVYNFYYDSLNEIEKNRIDGLLYGLFKEGW